MDMNNVYENVIINLIRDRGPLRHSEIAVALNIGEKEGRKLTEVLRAMAAKGLLAFSGGKWHDGPPRASCEHCGGKGWVHTNGKDAVLVK